MQAPISGKKKTNLYLYKIENKNVCSYTWTHRNWRESCDDITAPKLHPDTSKKRPDTNTTGDHTSKRAPATQTQPHDATVQKSSVAPTRQSTQHMACYDMALFNGAELYGCITRQCG